MARVCFDKTPGEAGLWKGMWVFREANCLHPRSEIQWEREAWGWSAEVEVFAKARRGVWFGFVFRISIYGFA